MARAAVRLWLATVLVGVAMTGTARATAGPHTWYVRAAASGASDGSLHRPFSTLAAVQRAAAPGDRIVVLPSPATVAPLSGGIALKPGQSLIGAGPAVVGLPSGAAAPRIANAGGHNHGNAVILADHATVQNVAVVGADRSGIYGSDVEDVVVRGNDVTGANTSCGTGFVVQPFKLPTAVPGVGVPFSSGLPNGLAAILIDESTTTTNVSIVGNRVHDMGCADGIDVRVSGRAKVTARVRHNTVTRLREGSSKLSVLAIGMQTRDHSRLRAELSHNTETYIGTASVGNIGDADSEGVFVNAAGRSHLLERVDHNTFAHGLGHLSANCIEVAATDGRPTASVTVTKSTCHDVVGDIIEAANLANGVLKLTLDRVRAWHSTWPLAAPQSLALPGDDGDCLLEVTSGSGSVTRVKVRDSVLTDCVGDGVGVVSNNVAGGSPIKRVSVDIEDSRVVGNRLSNLRVENASSIRRLTARIERSDVSRSAGIPIFLANPFGAVIHGATVLDLGGGTLGSSGGNCIEGGVGLDVLAVGYDLAAQHNWWGVPGGPKPGRTAAVAATITTDRALRKDTCGPAAGRHSGGPDGT